jgi:hypothetical protein
VWVKFAPPFPLMISYTDDSGDSWSDPVAINDPPNRSAGGDICIGPGGEVYVCWAGVMDVSPFSEIHVGFASSGDGGSSWDIDEDAFEVKGITGLLTEKGNIRVNGLPGIAVDTTGGDHQNRIYIVTGQKGLEPAGSDPDIVLNYSDDHGSSWSQAIRVNQDPLSNGKIQYFPSIHVDAYGAVNIIFYDDRNTTSDSSGVFLARSADGGFSWKEYGISDHNFKPEPIGGLGQGYQGDNIDLSSTLEGIVPVWMDNSSGIYQVWTAQIDFSSLDIIRTHETGYSKLELLQNRPNPFREKTQISYILNGSSSISIKIYGPDGALAYYDPDKWKEKGKHEFTFYADSPGMYILNILLDGQSYACKMLCLP